MDALRRLEAAGVDEVVECLPVPGARLVEPLADKSRRCFGALYKREVEKGLSLLSQRDPEESVERGRLLWLLGRPRDAQREFLRARRAPQAPALQALTLIADQPEKAVSMLETATVRDPRRPWPHLRLAVARLHSQDEAAVRKALADLDAFEALADRPRAALLWRSLCLLRLGDFKSAQVHASRLIELEPERCAGWSLRSAARMLRGEVEAGVADFHESKEREPNGGFSPIDALVGGGAGGDRLSALDAAIRRRPKEACLYVERAELLRSSGHSRFDLALADYERAAALAPRRAWILAQMSRAVATTRGLAPALELLDEAVKLSPRSGWIRAWRGENLRLLGRLPDALRELDIAMKLMPWYAYAHAWHGAALAASKRWRPALASLDAAVTMEPTFPTSALALAARGRARRALGDWAGAVDDCTAAFLLDPKHEFVAARTAAIEDWRAGERALSRALLARPGHDWTLAWRGWARLHLGEPRAAVRDLSSARRGDARSWALSWRALARRALGEGGAARRDLLAALRLAPGHPLAARLLAEDEAAAGRPARALEILASCRGEGVLTASFYRLRSALLEKLGRFEEAREDAARAGSLDPKGS